MNRVQRLQLALSDARQKLATLLDLETRSDEQQAEADGLALECRNIDRDLGHALLAEPAPVDKVEQEDGEGRELRSLLGRSTLARYVGAALRGSVVDGAELELRETLLPGASDTSVPLDVLETPALEQRADTAITATPAGETLDTVASRIFTRTVAAAMGVSMPTVPAGERGYPVLTAGTGADMRARGVAQDAEAATVTVTNLSPVRLAARYLFSVEDAANLPSIESVLRMDLADAIGDQMDAQILSGDGTAPNVTGLFSGAGSLSVPSAETNRDTYESVVTKFHGLVDGTYARHSSEIRLLVGRDTYARFAALTSTAYRRNAVQMIREESNDVIVSARGTGEGIEGAVCACAQDQVYRRRRVGRGAGMEGAGADS